MLVFNSEFRLVALKAGEKRCVEIVSALCQKRAHTQNCLTKLPGMECEYIFGLLDLSDPFYCKNTSYFLLRILEVIMLGVFYNGFLNEILYLCFGFVV